MVKIRLRRMGTKGRPFYRVVVAKSTAGRNGSFIESIGVYDPVAQPKVIQIKEDRALYWLLQGAQPTETAAVIMNRQGILDKFFTERPTAKKNFSFLDKRTAATSVKSVMEPVAQTKVEEPAVVAEAPATEPVSEPEAAPEPSVTEEAPAAEAATEPTAEAGEESNA